MRRTVNWPRIAAAGLLVLVLLTAVARVAAPGGGASGQTTTFVPPNLPGQLTSPAPWPPNTAELRARLNALGLPALSREGTVLHIHVHLDVFVDGRHITVPAGIGIDPRGRFISPLHTHDASGVIHVESPTVRSYTLGQVFGVWGVRLGESCVGGYCAGGGKLLRVYVDGHRLSGNPGYLVLASHEEIVVAFGTAAQLLRPVPAHYAFPSGL
jgi:hypothetical protein